MRKSILCIIAALVLCSAGTGARADSGYKASYAPGEEILRFTGGGIVTAPYPYDGKFRYAARLNDDGSVAYETAGSLEEAVAATERFVNGITREGGLKLVIESEVAVKAAQIKEIQRSQRDGFFFWTDTHLQENRLNAPMYMQMAIDPDCPQKVVFGGDGIPAFIRNIDKWWTLQKRLNAQIMQFATLYCLRGNHDFTCKYAPDSKEGLTWSNEKTAAAIAGSMNGSVCRNDKDPGCCYYYFDVPDSKLRYIAFDTTDSIISEDSPFGTVYGVGDVQYDWIMRNAVLAAPRGYSLIILSHIPSNMNMEEGERMQKFSDAVAAIAGHRDFQSGGQVYKLSGRKDLDLLFVLSGHHHHDIQFFTDDVLSVATACDACYKDFVRSPFVTDRATDRSRTELCQAFDYVSISKDSKTVTMKRMGSGDDRVYHLQRIVLRPGEKKKMHSSIDDKCIWTSYDGLDNRYVRGPDYTGHWELSDKNIAVGPDGTLMALREGEAIAVASRDGIREFFLVRVKAGR